MSFMPSMRKSSELLLLLTIAWLGAALPAQAHAHEMGKVVISHGQICALNSFERVQCWDGTALRPIRTVQLVRPVDLASNDERVCALDQDKLRCWNDSDGLQLETAVTGWSGVRQIVIGKDHVCGLGSDGIHCVGASRDGQFPPQNPFGSTRPIQIAAATFYTCALYEDSVSCWGHFRTIEDDVAWEMKGGYYHFSFEKTDLFHLETPRPSKCLRKNGDSSWAMCFPLNFGELPASVGGFRNARQLALSRDGACVLDDDGVKCWQHMSGEAANVRTLAPASAFKAPSRIYLGDRTLFVVDGGKLRHYQLPWTEDRYRDKNFPFNDVSGMSKFTYSDRESMICGFVEAGLHCYGPSYRLDKTLTWKEMGAAFKLDSMPEHLRQMARYAYSYKATFFKQVASLIAKTESPQARLVVIRETLPLVKSIGSSFFENDVLAAYEGVLSGADASTSANLSEARSEVLELVGFALSASRPFLAHPRSLKDLDALLSGIAQAVASGDASSAAASLARSRKFDHLIAEIQADSRTTGFGELLGSIQRQLKTEFPGARAR
jgi:hypothetical protein